MTGPFWHFAAMLLRHRVLALTAMVCAVISAAGLGSGLVALGPMLEIVLGEAGSLQAIAAKFSVDHPTLAIPDSLIQMLPADARGSLAAVLSGLGVMTVIGATANFLHQYISISLCSGIVARIRLEAFAHSIRLPLTTVVARGPAEFTSRILRDAGELQSGLSTLTSRMVSQVLKGVASFAAAIWFDWRLTLFALVCGPIIAVILRKAGKQIRRGIRGSLEAQQGLLRVAGESLQGLRSIKSARAESEMIRRFGALNREALSQELRARIARAAASPVIEVIGILVAVGLAYVAGVQILKGQARFEDFLLAMGSLAAMGSSLRPVTGFITELQAANAPASRLLELLDSPLERSGESEKRIAPRFSKELRLDHVTVRYPTGETDALHEVSLTIHAGEHLAIVGPNGCGKTTLLSLLGRLIEPTAGRLTVDGRELQSMNLGAWRRQIALVAQEPLILNDTVAHNIRLGNPNATHAQVRAAADAAHATAFIERMAGGFDAVVAEHGASLSGGQRQRIAIARAALANPAILLLDEATSQVDAESESQIGDALRELGRGRTVITVAHRFSTVLAADRIVVLDHGKIESIGTHESLLKSSPLYQRLARAQFLTAG